MNDLTVEKYPYSILLVDDEDLTRDNYTSYLESKFENVYEAKDGHDAYDVYLKKSPDIIITDIKMPRMNGIEFISKVRENDHSTKVIFMTSHRTTDYLLESTCLKLSKFLVKPISRVVFKCAIDIVIDELVKYKTISNDYILLTDNFSYKSVAQEIYHNNILVKTTKKEKELLDFFFKNQNKFVTYLEITQHIWNETNQERVESIKNILKKLRRKLPSGLIENIYGVGYKLNI